MSSSVFIETASRRSPLMAAEESAENEEAEVDLYGEPSSVAADANLVVVIKNDRVHMDSDGLERFIEDKTINSLSVIRITSPTPSMEEEDARIENEEERVDKGSSENETSDVDISCESGGSENSLESAKLENEELAIKDKKKQKLKKKKQKAVLGIHVEKYFLREDAEILLKSVMQKSGLIKPKRTARQEAWLQNIMNDHCYTSWDTAVKHASDVPAIEAGTVVEEKTTATPTTVSKEIRVLKRQKELTEDLKSKQQTDEDEEDEDQHTSNAEEEGDSEYETENFDSSDTDNDRDSDLDFKVNNNSSKKATRKKRKNPDKKASRRSINFKHKNARRLSNETEEANCSAAKARARKPLEHVVRIQPRLEIKRTNPVKVEKEIPLVEEKPKDVIINNPAPQATFMLPKFPKTTQPKELIVEKKLINPIVAFTEPVTKLETNQKFVQLEPASVHELPVQISIQTHASKSELAAEADKQLDLINLFVTHELQQTAVKPVVESTQVESKMADKSIPAIVKMLEGEDTEDHTGHNINAVDLMPPDILDHVTDLLKNDPALQQVVIDDSVFSEQDETAVLSVTDNDTTQLGPQIGDIIKIETPMKVEPVVIAEPVTPFAATAMQQGMTSTPIQAPAAVKEEQQTPTVTEDWKVVKLGNGRVINLPPMEAPTTRSRKRAQTTNSSVNPEVSGGNSAIENESTNQTELKLTATPKTLGNESKPATELMSSVNKSRGKKSASKNKVLLDAAADLPESQGEVDDDDPNKLWCICRKPHGNRFMICCDTCENWFHGKCVGVSSAQGKVLENQNKPWNCPQCLKNLTGGAQTPATATQAKRKKNSAGSKEPEGNVDSNLAAAAVDSKLKTAVSKVQTHITQFLPGAGFTDAYKTKTVAQKKVMNAFLTEPTSMSNVSPVTKQTGDPCLICKHPSRKGAIYCSDECIRRHVQNSLQAITKSYETAKANSEKKGLFEEILLMADVKPKVERINVIDRKSGNIISGIHAPTISNLKKFLQENPTYEVILPGTPEANELESKQNKQKPAIINKPLVTPTKMTVTKVIVAKEATPPKKLPRQLSNSGSGLSTQKFYKSQDSSKDSPRNKSEQTEKLMKANSGSENIVQTESIRDNIVKTLSASLRQRMNNVDDVASFKLKDDEIEDFVRGVEEEMFRYFNGENNSKYKSRYRQLIFNIKDPKNQTLFRKIFYKEVTPVQLAHMSVEELASQELAQWRKQENQHQLDIIKKTELDMMYCSKNLVVKTHKGEEIIDLDHKDLMGMEQSLGVEDPPLLEQPVHAPKVDSFYENLQSSISRKEYGVVGKKENEQISTTVSTSVAKVLDVEKHKEEKEKKEDADKHKHKDREREREKEREKQRERDKDKHEKRHRSRERQKLRKRSKSRSRSAERSQERTDKRHKSSNDRRRDKDKEKDKERKRHDDKEREREREKTRSRDMEREKEKERAKDAVKERKQSSSNTEPNASNKRPASSQKDKKEFKNNKEIEKKTQKPLEVFSLIDLIIENTKTVEEAANLVPEKKKEPTEAPPAVVTTTTTSKQLNIELSPQEPTSTIVSPPQDIYARYTESDVPPLWCGNLNMVDVASFQIVMKPLLGDSQQINKLLPTELDVVGRIIPDTVWDYISKINQSYNKKIVLVQLLPASTTETCAYQVLLQYLAKRNRLGVIKTTSPQIKDFYMFPLVTGKRLPAVLESMETNAFFEDSERPDMLIGIMIRVFSKRFHQQSASGNLPLPTSTKHRRLTESSISKRHSNLDPSAKDDGFDIDDIIKAPIAGKIGGGAKSLLTTKSTTTTSSIDLDEPYSPGSADDDMPLLPILSKPALKASKVVDPEFKYKINELNKQIALQEKEIAGLLHVDQSTTASNVLANISIPSNLSQILASIKNKTVEATQSQSHAQTHNMDTVTSSSSSYQHVDLSDAADEEYNPEDDIAYAYSSSKTVKSLASVSVTSTSSTSTSRLATLSEAELLSMVPDDMLEVTAPSRSAKKTVDYEPPPPGV